MRDITETRLSTSAVGPIAGSTKHYAQVPGIPGMRVPWRRVNLSNGEHLDLYDTSGPYTDAEAALDLKAGLPRTRDEWDRPAPAYDVVPQAHLKNDGKLALAVNRKYRHSDVTGKDLLTEFTSWGLRRAAVTICDTLEQLEAIAKDEVPVEEAFPALQEQILGFVGTLRGDRR